MLNLRRPFRKLLNLKIFNLGIRAKLMFIILGITTLLTLALMLYVHTILRAALAEQLDHKTISIARNVAARSMEPILTNNIFALHQVAYNTLENNDDVYYVFFEDGAGHILVHTFKDYFPPDLLGIKRSLTGKEYDMKKFMTEEGVLRDIAIPVDYENESQKIARIGLIDYSLQSALVTATRQLLLIALAVFLITSAIVYILTTIIAIKPINYLLYSVQAVAKGDLSQQVKVSSHDEISKLAAAFNIMTQRLAETRKVRDQLMKKLIYSQEEERRRISRELHDETGQSLMTMMIALRFLEESKDLNELKHRTEEFRSILKQSIEQVRLMAWNLTPTLLADLGLKNALESFIKKINKNRDWEISLQVKGLDNKRLAPEIEISAYRIVQEAMTNIAKHAQASKVSICLSCSEQTLEITIKDNGKGFNTDKLKTEQGFAAGLGLISMQERVALLKGTFDIKSKPAQGTTIHVVLPLEIAEEKILSADG